MEEVWEYMWEGVKCYGPVGPRDVLIIRCRESLEGPDIVPRKEGCLTAEDKERLSSEGIPSDCWGDDVQLMEARYGREGRFHLLPPLCGEGLTRQSVMEKIRTVMKETDKPGGEYNYEYNYCNMCISQSVSSTLVLARRALETGALQMASSLSKT